MIAILPASISARDSLLRAELRGLGRVLVAYSGGVDSAYLAWAAHQVLGDGMLAVIADSPSLARTQLADAIAFAHEQGIPLEVIPTSELENPEYVRNDGQRCFFCKDELFEVMEALRAARGFDAIAYDVNLDDQGDFRPGQRGEEAPADPLAYAGLADCYVVWRWAGDVLAGDLSPKESMPKARDAALKALQLDEDLVSNSTSQIWREPRNSTSKPSVLKFPMSRLGTMLSSTVVQDLFALSGRELSHTPRKIRRFFSLKCLI